MSLHIYDDLAQGESEWHDVRRGIVTASVVGRLIATQSPATIEYDCPACKAVPNQPCRSKRGDAEIKTLHGERVAVAASDKTPPALVPAETDDARGLTALLAAERITGYTDPTFMSSDMWRGVEDEPRARDVYSEHFAPVTEVGFMVEDKWGFSIGFSPDGLVGDDGLIEVKSRRQKTQLLTVIDGEIPAANYAQLQCGLLVSGRRWCDYISYAGGMHLWVKRVHPDPQWFDAITAAVAQFETTAAEMVAAYELATRGMPATERVIELEMVI